MTPAVALERARAALSDGDLDAALEHYGAAARAGDPATVAEAADVVRRAGRKDLARVAQRWLDEAAASDDGALEYVRALYAFHGFGEKKDLSRALALHREAAARGHADAMFELYAMLAQGLGTPPDGDEALAWCERAAAAGNARAMSNLGGFYAVGNGVPKDPAQSVAWYARAAEAGHGKAAATLGIMYATGADVARDLDAARGWFARADELGYDWRALAAQVGLS